MSTLSRRRFLHSIGATAAVLRTVPLRAATQLPIAFSTLGCPKWPWKTILENARANGYAAIELRGIEGEMNLPKRQEFAPGAVAASLKDLSALNLKVSDLGASSMLHSPDEAKRTEQIDEAKRFIDLAHTLAVPYVRVFPNNYVANESKATTIARIADALRGLATYAKGSGVTVIVESHGDFTDSPSLLDLMKQSGDGVALLWDTHHTCVEGKEKPADTFAALGSYVRHTHIKDSVPAGADRHYVLTGKGDVPIADIVRTLVAGGYRGYYCFEWEKTWHPDIDEPEVAIPQYANAMRGYLTDAGYKS
jgi:sugar phosphate isomerase/epimerase